MITKRRAQVYWVTIKCCPRSAYQAEEGRQETSPHSSPATFDTFTEELEQKYNIEGCNTADMFMRASKMTCSKIAKEQQRNQELERWLAEYEARAVPPNAVTDGEGSVTDNADVEGQGDALADVLVKENAELKAQLVKLAKTGGGAEAAKRALIPHPASTTGMQFSICEAMGLAGSHADCMKYKAIQDTPVASKAALFEVATEELVKQFIKNKCNNAYQKGYIPVPAQYGYLKAKLAKVKATTKKSAKKAHAGKPSKSSKSSQSGKKVVGKGKQKAVVTDNEDEDEEMAEAGGSGGHTEDKE
ncbi:hypothetical protein DFH07DRAFT_775928 [Mycena maculata]|uniref:Uncharacterized protein n=1 Tax=Mycena maculata TaxID=230809 RepID=A0AAD7N7P8_9AGAR|nr:hypothetical protein DFH07DRAFT_775928 [Mycena maculata]